MTKKTAAAVLRRLCATAAARLLPAAAAAALPTPLAAAAGVRGALNARQGELSAGPLLRAPLDDHAAAVARGRRCSAAPAQSHPWRGLAARAAPPASGAWPQPARCEQQQQQRRSQHSCPPSPPPPPPPPPPLSLSAAEAEADVRASAALAARELRERLGKARPSVVVGVSGGVDSALAALLLKQEGLDVRGVFLKNWDESEESADGRACSYEADRADARLVAKHVGIDLEEVDFVKEYWNEVFSPFLDAAAAGLTPNPDLECNRAIKFGAFLRWARDRGADAVATGHYARIAPAGGGSEWPRLLRGVDHTKDQTYFLASVPGSALNHVRVRDSCFPMGGARKAAVRAAAAALGLPSAGRRSSAGICFIGRRSFDEFLTGYVRPTPGEFRSVEDPSGPALGAHGGAELFTHGQRARIGGAASPWFVVGKDPRAGTVWVAQGGDHPALFSRAAVADGLFWVDGRPPADLLGRGGGAVGFKARYGQPVAEAAARVVTVAEAARAVAPSAFSGYAAAWQEGGGGEAALVLNFAEPARAITPGQAIVLYRGDVCLGGGVLRFSGRSCFEEVAAVGGGGAAAAAAGDAVCA